MFKNELSQNRYREKLRRSLISQLESQKTNIEPFLDKRFSRCLFHNFFLIYSHFINFFCKIFENKWRNKCT